MKRRRFFDSRAPHTNWLTPSLTLPASRDPRAGPSGGTLFPDRPLLATEAEKDVCGRLIGGGEGVFLELA